MLLDPSRLADLGWSMEPGVIVPLTLSAALYGRGAIVLAGRGHGLVNRRQHVASFAAGWLVVAVALLSPLHEISEQLFSAHMVQHELLMALAAPLLVLGRPLTVMLWGLPRATRRFIASGVRHPIVRSTWRTITRPFDAWLIHGIAIWLWHLPVLFDATLRSESIHAIQHTSFMGSALLFWWSVIHGQRRAARGMSILYLFTTAVHTGVLGALMTFSRTPWYPTYADRATAWGLTPMMDQQLAGLIMWIPASLAYLIAALSIMRHWLRESEWTVLAQQRTVSATSGR